MALRQKLTVAYNYLWGLEDEAPSPPAEVRKLELRSRVKLVTAMKTALQSIVRAHAELTLASEYRHSSAEGSSESSKGARLTPSLFEVRELLLCVEQCLFHRLKRSQFENVLPFWTLLGCMDRSLPPDLAALPEARALRDSIHFVRGISSLTTAVGRARAWVRVAVEREVLGSALTVLLKQPDLLASFYESPSLMRCDEGSSIFASLCFSLATFEFHDLLQNADSAALPDLNHPPSWPLLAKEVVVSVDPQETASSACDSAPPRLSDIVLHRRLDDQLAHVLESSASPRSSFEAGVAGDGGNSGEWVELDGQDLAGESTPPGHIVAPAPPPKRLLQAWENRVFGIPLEVLIADARRTRWGPVCTQISVPDALLSLTEALSDPGAAATPGLFRASVSASQVIRVVRFLDRTNQLPRSASPHALAAALLFFLHKLPQPLLTYEYFDGFIACGAASLAGSEPEEDTIRSLRKLVCGLPWAHRPCLLRLLDLWCIDLPRHADESGLSVEFLGTMLAPALLRPYGLEEIRAEEEGDPEMGAARARVVSLLLLNQEVVCEGLRLEQVSLGKLVRKKLCRLRQLQRMQAAKVYLRLKEHLSLIKTLWSHLGAAEAAICASLPGDAIPSSPSSFSLHSRRWITCGCASSEDQVEAELRGAGSFFALDCLTYLLEAYPHTGSRIVLSAVGLEDTPTLLRRTGLVAAEIMLFSGIALPGSTSGGDEIEGAGSMILRAARGKCWKLLDERWALQELFVAAMLVLEALVHAGDQSSPKTSFPEAFKGMQHIICEALDACPSDMLEFFQVLCRKSNIPLYLSELDLSRQSRSPRSAPSVDSASAPSSAALSSSAPSDRDLPIIVGDRRSLFLHLDEDEEVGLLEGVDLRQSEAGCSSLYAEAAAEDLALLEANLFRARDPRGEDLQLGPLADVAGSRFDEVDGELNVDDFLEEMDANIAGVRGSAPDAEVASSLRCRLLCQSEILADDQVHLLAAALPLTLQSRDWKLLYRLDSHGSSMNTILRLCKGEAPTLVVILDDGSPPGVLGGLTSGAPWTDSESFYGDGTGFVFSSEGCREGLRIFHWTGANDYAMFSSTSKGMGMGGGGEGFAWFLDESLCNGSSGTSATFGNSCLASAPEFCCTAMEIWSFASP